MTDSRPDKRPGAIAELLHPEGRLLERVRGVLRFDADVYREIAHDPGAIPQAFVVVIATAFLVGIGAGSLPGIFGGMAWAIVNWLVVAALVWAAGSLIVGSRSDYAPLLRVLGFAYVWFGVFIGYGLPVVGWIFGWAAVLLCLTANVFAVRACLEITTERALAVCAVSLGLPLLLLWSLF